MHTRLPLLCALLAILFTAVLAPAVVGIDSHGRWPTDWPKALEPLRDQARTIEVASGTQENIYEITFTDRAQFEKAWPDLIALKTPGAPLRLYKVGALPSYGLGQLESNAAPTVRIYCPPDGETISPDGQKLKAVAPWPKEIQGPNGELPEFVTAQSVAGKFRWVKLDEAIQKGRSFHYRARVDIDLVTDGQVVDLNRIALPGDTPIEDHRF